MLNNLEITCLKVWDQLSYFRNAIKLQFWGRHDAYVVCFSFGCFSLAYTSHCGRDCMVIIEDAHTRIGEKKTFSRCKCCPFWLNVSQAFQFHHDLELMNQIQLELITKSTSKVRKFVSQCNFKLLRPPVYSEPAPTVNAINNMTQTNYVFKVSLTNVPILK